MQQPFDLSGKVALVTGAYRGLGFAIAQGLARAGAKVVLNGRRQDALDAAAQLLRDEQLEVSTCLFDVTDRDAIGAGVAAIESSIGAVDILFNNAGIQRRGTFADFPQEQWDEIIATNLTAPFAVSQAVLPQMIAKKRGKIVHIASLMSELARPSVVPYTAAKGGVQTGDVLPQVDGQAVDQDGNAIIYDGTSWSAPVPIDFTGDELLAVSCPSVSFCAAVDGGGNAMTYDGRSWSTTTCIAAACSNATGSLDAVSCSSATFCVTTDGENAITYRGTTDGP